MKILIEKARNIIKKNLDIFLMLIVIYTNYISLQASTHVARRIFATKPIWLIYNLLLLLAIWLLIKVSVSKMYICNIVFSSFCTIWGLVNDYVYALHGQVFTLAEITNIKTALNVVADFSWFKIKPLIFACVILFIFAFNLLLCYVQWKGEKDKQSRNKGKIKKIAISIIIICLMSLPAKTCQEIILKDWTARNVCIEEGYPMYVYANALLSTGTNIIEPEGYDENLLLDYVEYRNEIEDEIKPDIILILNEAFFDLSLVTELKTDIPYLDNFYNLDNAIRGYAVTPVIGGATNRSEFELLTSNTTFLLGELTPFNFLDMSDTASVVSSLKEQGYYTIAAHPADGGNYNRIKSYSGLGFDERYFEEDFENYIYYGKREWMTDQGAYNNMIIWHENARIHNKPVFSYMLTMQNHSDYGINNESDAIVHVQEYSGSIEKELNEYLSCIYLSDLAFKELTDYYAKQERPVIICMVGDHAMSLVSDVTDVNSSVEREILARATPFIIWANYDIEDKEMGIISVNGLGPLLLETAGVEMTPFYRYIRTIQEEVPVIGSFGRVMDKDGNIYSYYDDMQYSDMLWKYMWLSYNNLQETSIDGWFLVEK